MSMSNYLISEILILGGCWWSAHLLDFLPISSYIFHLCTPICKLHPEEDGLILLKHTAKQSPAWPTHTLPKATCMHRNVSSYIIFLFNDIPSCECLLKHTSESGCCSRKGREGSSYSWCSHNLHSTPAEPNVVPASCHWGKHLSRATSRAHCQSQTAGSKKQKKTKKNPDH